MPQGPLTDGGAVDQVNCPRSFHKSDGMGSMTSLVAWVGADSRGPASLNIAADSRITWPGHRGISHAWDYGKKVFASSREPLIIGFTGDVLFPSLVLQGLLDRIDQGVVPRAESILDHVYSVLRHGWENYPGEERRAFSVLACHRLGQGAEAEFHAEKMGTTSNGVWQRKELPVQETSQIVALDGSGKDSVKEAIKAWQVGKTANTSRAIFSGFVDAVTSGNDRATGGSPQIGAIYRIGAGRLLGIAHEGSRYFAGARLLGTEAVGAVEWRNSLFERTDGVTKARLAGAQVHERPI